MQDFLISPMPLDALWWYLPLLVILGIIGGRLGHLARRWAERHGML